MRFKIWRSTDKDKMFRPKITSGSVDLVQVWCFLSTFGQLGQKWPLRLDGIIKIAFYGAFPRDIFWCSNQYFRACGFWSSEIFRKNFIRYETVSASSKINNYRKNSSFAKIWEKEKSVLIKMLVYSVTQSQKWQFGKFKNRVSHSVIIFDQYFLHNSNIC